MMNFWKDIRHSLRSLRGAPMFTAIAVLTLSLGIGANTAIFSLVNSVLLRPLPVNDASQITVLTYTREHGALSTQISYPALEDLRQQSNSPFTDLIGYQFGSDGLDVDGKAYALFTNYVTGNYFEVLGVKPAVGRLILPTEGKVAGADPVIVLSYSLWKARFGGDPNMVGKKVRVDGHPFTVIGVTAEGFHGLTTLIDARAYIPYAMHVSLTADFRGDLKTNALTDRKIQNVTVFGRSEAGRHGEAGGACIGADGETTCEIRPGFGQRFGNSSDSGAEGASGPRLIQSIVRGLGTFSCARRICADSCVHERGEYFAGEGNTSQTRNGDSRGARRNSRAVDSFVAHGKRFAFSARRRGRSPGGHLAERIACKCKSWNHVAARARFFFRLASLQLCNRRRADDRCARRNYSRRFARRAAI